MKTVSLNTILDLLDYYGQICDEEVETGNQLLITIETLLPFEGLDEIKDWNETTDVGTYEEFIECTYDVLWNAALRDYRLFTEMLKGAKFGEWSIEGKRFTSISVMRWDNEMGISVATIYTDFPFIGYNHCDEWIFQGCSFKDFVEDTISDLNRKMKQVARRLGKEMPND